MNQVPESVQKVLGLYIDSCNKQLPGLLEGVYLHGSIAIDAYMEGESDIDFVSVTSRKLTNEDTEILKGIHRNLAETCEKPQLDGIYVRWASLADEGYFYNDGVFGEAVHDIPITWWLLKNKGITVMGPAIQNLPLNVTIDDLTAYVRKNMKEYWASRISAIEQRKDELIACPIKRVEAEMEWIVLGLLRQFFTLKEKSITSKLGAGKFGLQELDYKWHRLIQEAIHIRTGNSNRSFSTNAERVESMISFAKELMELCEEKYGG